MVRAKPAETAEKKVTPTRKTVAAKKPVQEVKAEEVKEEEVKEDEVVESVEVAEEGGEGDGEAVEESGENAEGTEEQQQEGGGEGEGEGEGGDAEVKQEKEPLSEEDLAYINEMLETKHKFADDTESPIFSYGPPKVGSDSRSVVCHLCRVANLHRPGNIKTHLNGKRHKENLKRKTLTASRIQQPYLQFYSHDGDNKVKQFKILPGENIPEVTPELEDRIVDKVEWDMKKIDDEKLLKTLSEDPIYEYNKIKPIIGLDYLLKMKHKNQIKCYCVLCEVLLTNDVYQHVTDIKHQATYIIKHFPKLYEKVVAGLKVNGDRAKENCIRNIFRKLYRKIEIKHGFKVMQPVDAGDFFSVRARYLNKVRRSPHYSEETLQFTEAEVNVLIKKSNNNISFNEPDPPMLPESGAKSILPRKRRGPSEPEAPVIKSARLDADEVSRWEKYEVIKEGRIERLKAQYKRFENDPKLHPSYQKEWSQFWHTRCSELRKANINPDTYNFEKEWRPYWEKRLRKLYHKDIVERKTNLRKNFNLPIGKRTPSPYRPRVPKNKPIGLMDNPASMMLVEAMMSVPNAGLRNANNFVPPLNNQQTFVGGGGAGVGGRPGQGGIRGRVRAGNRNAPQQQQQQQVQQQQQQQPSRKRPAPSRSREPVSVISVLRLLTALEDQLGSLGPKSVQLLGKAVLCEKNNNSKQLLTDNEYYVLFATAKEKLKGQIMANVIDKSKMHAVETTIEDLNRIINMMDKENRNRGGGGGGGGAAGGGNSHQNANVRGGNYGGENFGRNNAGGNNNSGGNFRNEASQNNAGGNFRNDGYRSDGGNFRNGNGNFAGNNANYRSNTDSFGGMNDGGNYRSGFNDDNASNRMTSNFDNSNYRSGNDGGMYRNQNDGGNFGNSNTMGGGNYRSNNDDMGTFRGGNFNNNDSGNYRPTTGGGGGNFSNSSNSNFANYRGGNDLTGGNYSSTGSSFGGGGSNTGGGMGFTPNTNQYRSGGNYSDNFNTKSSNFGGSGGGGVAGSNSSSAQRGSWMGGSGNVYSNKSNANTPAYSSGLGGFNSQQQTNSFTPSYSSRNNPPAPSFNMSSGGGSGSNYRRYN